MAGASTRPTEDGGSLCSRMIWSPHPALSLGERVGQVVTHMFAAQAFGLYHGTGNFLSCLPLPPAPLGGFAGEGEGGGIRYTLGHDDFG